MRYMVCADFVSARWLLIGVFSALANASAPGRPYASSFLLSGLSQPLSFLASFNKALRSPYCFTQWRLGQLIRVLRDNDISWPRIGKTYSDIPLCLL